MPIAPPTGPELHLYDQDRRWVAGGTIIPGLTHSEALSRVAAVVVKLPPDPETWEERMHVRQGGKPALYRWTGSSADMKPLPAPTPGVEPGPVYETDARDRHLLGPDEGRSRFGRGV